MHTKHFELVLEDYGLADTLGKLVKLEIRLLKLKRGELSHEFQGEHVGIEVCNAILQTEREIKYLKEKVNG